MNTKEFFLGLNDVQVNSSLVDSIENLYGCVIPDIIRKAVSLTTETIFFDDNTRLMSNSEILEAEKDLHVEFVKKGILPFIDCGDNDFIVYHFTKNKWSKYNIIDDVSFKIKDSLLELF